MALSEVLEHIDQEIARLQQARQLLSGADAETPKPTRGRPKGSKKAKPEDAAASIPEKAKRNLSPEGRKAIAEAMKRRWADRRNAATT